MTSGWGMKGVVSCCWPLPPTSKQAHKKKNNLLTKQPFVIIRCQALTTVLQDFPVILTDSRFRGTPTLPWLSHLILQKAQLAEAFYNLRTTTSSSNLQSSSQKYTLLRNLFQLKLKGIWNSFEPAQFQPEYTDFKIKTEWPPPALTEGLSPVKSLFNQYNKVTLTSPVKDDPCEPIFFQYKTWLFYLIDFYNY